MRNTLIEFMDGLREYVQESGTNIAHDERDSSEFVDIFLKQGQTLPIDNVCISLFCRCPQAKGRDNDENGTPYCIECQNPIDERQIL